MMVVVWVGIVGCWSVVGGWLVVGVLDVYVVSKVYREFADWVGRGRVGERGLGNCVVKIRV